MFGLQNEREWAQFCAKVLRRPELAEDSRFKGNAQRVANRDEVRRLIVEAFEPLTAAEAIERIEDAQIANAQVNDMRGVWAHPQLRARARWREVGRLQALSRRCCRPGRGTTARRAWTRCLRSASTPTPSSRHSATQPTRSANSAQRRPSEQPSDIGQRGRCHARDHHRLDASSATSSATDAHAPRLVRREPHGEVPRRSRGRWPRCRAARASSRRRPPKRSCATATWRRSTWSSCAQQTEQIGYPVLGVVSQLNALCRDKLGEYCHWGATTQDITDTATVLQIREGLALVERDLADDRRRAGALARKSPRLRRSSAAATCSRRFR